MKIINFDTLLLELFINDVSAVYNLTSRKKEATSINFSWRRR